jgi:hypothetical protein
MADCAPSSVRVGFEPTLKTRVILAEARIQNPHAYLCY